MQEIISGRMSDRDVLCKGRLSNTHLSKKCSRRAVVVRSKLLSEWLEWVNKVAGMV